MVSTSQVKDGTGLPSGVGLEINSMYTIVQRVCYVPLCLLQLPFRFAVFVDDTD